MNADRPLVITHGNCIDGFCAAWIMAGVLGPDTIFFNALYGAPPPAPELVAGRVVYMVDFSYPREEMRAIAEMAKNLTVFDHHETAVDNLIGLQDELNKKGLDVRIVFDMKRSGAGIAWDEMLPDHLRPWLVNYVEDRDLWRWKFRKSEEVNAYIGTVPHEMHSWETLHKTDIVDAMKLGEGILAYIREYSRCVLRDARRVNFLGHPAVVVNAHYKSISEVLHYALEYTEDAEVAVGWYRRADGNYQYSLRSRKPDGPKVNELAREYGGGGHPNSAGFLVVEELIF